MKPVGRIFSTNASIIQVASTRNNKDYYMNNIITNWKKTWVSNFKIIKILANKCLRIVALIKISSMPP